MKIMPGYPPWGPLRACAHCGRAGGEAWFGGGTDSGQLCHPSDASLPDCYRRVTVYSEPVGALLGAGPKPAGVGGILRLDDAGRLVPSAEVAAMGEELKLYDAGPDCG